MDSATQQEWVNTLLSGKYSIDPVKYLGDKTEGNSRNKALWVAALRSGKYQQRTSALKRGDSFCCLGVLCDVYMKQTGKGYWDIAKYDDWFVIDEERRVGSLPREILTWVGITGKEEDDCIEFNDIDKKTFLEIADVIEKEWIEK